MKGTRFLFIATAAVTAIVLSGCVNLSGYDADSEFKCKAPEGVHCQSVSGNYANIKAGNEPKTKAEAEREKQKYNRDSNLVPAASLSLPAARNMGAGQSPAYMTAIRSEPTVLRTWIMTYRDTDGDIVDQSYIYLTMDTGQWLIEHNIQLMEETFAPQKSFDESRASELVPRAVPTNAAATGRASIPATPRQPFEQATPTEPVTTDSTGGDAASTEGTTGGRGQQGNAGTAPDTAAIMKKIQDAIKATGAQRGGNAN